MTGLEDSLERWVRSQLDAAVDSFFHETGELADKATARRLERMEALRLVADRAGWVLVQVERDAAANVMEIGQRHAAMVAVDDTSGALDGVLASLERRAVLNMDQIVGDVGRQLQKVVEDATAGRRVVTGRDR